MGIHGCGGVGPSAIMIASTLGANPIAIDIVKDKLGLARQFGAVATIDARRVADVAEAVRDTTGRGTYLSLDAFGSQVTCFNLIKSLCRRGATFRSD